MTRMRSATADYVFDMGPGAGVHGGQVVSRGTPAEIIRQPGQPDREYLSGTREIAVPKTRRRVRAKS
jgi:excinuclease ABC subunit A